MPKPPRRRRRRSPEEPEPSPSRSAPSPDIPGLARAVETAFADETAAQMEVVRALPQARLKGTSDGLWRIQQAREGLEDFWIPAFLRGLGEVLTGEELAGVAEAVEALGRVRARRKEAEEALAEAVLPVLEVDYEQGLLLMNSLSETARRSGEGKLERALENRLKQEITDLPAGSVVWARAWTLPTGKDHGILTRNTPHYWQSEIDVDHEPCRKWQVLPERLKHLGYHLGPTLGAWERSGSPGSEEDALRAEVLYQIDRREYHQDELRHIARERFPEGGEDFEFVLSWIDRACPGEGRREVEARVAHGGGWTRETWLAHVRDVRMYDSFREGNQRALDRLRGKR